MAEHRPVTRCATRQAATPRSTTSTAPAWSSRGCRWRALLGEGWLDVVHPDDLAHCIGTYVSGVRGAQAVPHGVPRPRRADGVYRWLLDSGVPKFEAGRPLRWVDIGCSIDITERRMPRTRIRASRAALEASHRRSSVWPAA